MLSFALLRFDMNDVTPILLYVINKFPFISFKVCFSLENDSTFLLFGHVLVARTSVVRGLLLAVRCLD